MKNWDDLYDELKPESPPTDTFRTYSIAEMKAFSQQKMNWALRGFMIDGTYGMLAGEEKSLKTHLSIMTTIALASGVPLLGKFLVSEPKPVVVYVGEGGKTPYSRKLFRIAEAMGVNLDDVPLFHHFDIKPIKSDEFQATLVADLKEHEPGLVVVDPFYAFHGTEADARNLYEEGSLLSSLSGPVVEAGSSLSVVNHFNKTGSGKGLNRITMAGAKEWCDSWWLLGHNTPPNVNAGSFDLSLQIGSRQWGGSSWSIKMELGVFDPDLGEYDGDFRFECHPASEAGDLSHEDEKNRVLDLVIEHPGVFTKDELAKVLGGKKSQTLQLIETIERTGLIKPELQDRIGKDSKKRRSWVYIVPNQD